MQKHILSVLGLMLFVMATLLVATSERLPVSVIMPSVDNTMDVVAQEVAFTGIAEQFALANIENKLTLDNAKIAGRAGYSVITGQIAHHRGTGLWHRIDLTRPRIVLAEDNITYEASRNFVRIGHSDSIFTRD